MVQLPCDEEQEDVMLTPDVICGKCGINMKQVAPNKWQCGTCGYVYTE